MTEASSVVSLEEVRARFLEAEARLEEASEAVATIEAAAASLGSTRESLSTAGDQVAGLATRFGDVADSLGENATHLREGVDAIRLGDPAAIRRQIEELDEAFTAMQAVTGERMTAVETSITKLGEQLTAVELRRQASERRALILAVVTIVGIVVVAVLQLVV
jgi:chromosome segregation ATPase